MKLKILLLSLFFFLGILSGWSQQNDSTVVCLKIEELRTITKMTEDLRYTKIELEMADSIILHQSEVIELKNQELYLKNLELQENLRKSYRRQIKVGVVSGLAGIVVGVILGVIL